MKGQFSDKFETTGLAENHHSFTWTVHGKEIQVEISDSAGEEIFSTYDHWKQATSFMVCASVTKGDLDHDASSKIYSIERADEITKRRRPILVVGTKCDLDQERKTSRSRAMEVCKNVAYVETSAKTGQNVQLAFRMLIELDLAFHSNVVYVPPKKSKRDGT